ILLSREGIALLPNAKNTPTPAPPLVHPTSGDKSAFTRVFDALCPALTASGGRIRRQHFVSLAELRKNVHIVTLPLTSRDIHHKLCPSRRWRGAVMRRHEGGAGPAPAGVVRSCTPGRTPEQPRQLLRAGPGPGTVERESGKSRWRAGQARSFFWRLLWRAT